MAQPDGLLGAEHPPNDLGDGHIRTGSRSFRPWDTPALPRKEVIQPHLPVQLPCYDFVPVTGPTLGTCLPCGLAQRLRVFSASMT